MAELRVQLPGDVPVAEALLLLAFKLCESGRLSAGEAAKLAGYSKRAFLELMGKHGVPVFDYPATDLERELGE